MSFALTTRWNAGRHTDGEALIEEILGMGFRHVELGYDLRRDLVPGVMKMVEKGAVKVDSVHNYCPVPMGAPYGHPELFTLADRDATVNRKETPRIRPESPPTGPPRTREPTEAVRRTVAAPKRAAKKRAENSLTPKTL